MNQMRDAKRILPLAASSMVALITTGFDSRRPLMVSVGSRDAASPMAQIDPARTSLATGTLPIDSKIAWRVQLRAGSPRTTSVSSSGPPVVDSHGNVTASNGDLVVQYTASGEEVWRIAVGSRIGPLSLLPDASVVGALSNGDIVFLSRGVLRTRMNLGGDPNLSSHVAPLPLEAGGILVSTSAAVFLVSEDGEIRYQKRLPEPLAGPLLATGGQVYGVGVSGTVYPIVIGRSIEALGTFGAPLDATGAAAVNASLVGISQDGRRLLAFDVTTKQVAVRHQAQAGRYLGPPAVRGSDVYVLAETPGATYVSVVHGDGKAIWTKVSSSPASVVSDAGLLSLPGAHPGMLVDQHGTVAFVGMDGQVGTVADGGQGGAGLHKLFLLEPPREPLGLAPALRTERAFYLLTSDGELVKIHA